ncbi:hypothetical protein MHYP_G00252360 [Metynnis hypsauchen]
MGFLTVESRYLYPALIREPKLTLHRTFGLAPATVSSSTTGLLVQLGGSGGSAVEEQGGRSAGRAEQRSERSA